MKKTFRFFGMMLCVMLMAVGFTACSDDDDDDKNPSIVGTWYLESTYDVGTEYERTTYSEITHKKDGIVTGYWKETYKNGEVIVETDRGRYEVIKDVLSIWWEGEADDDNPWTCTFKIEGNRMITSENGGNVWIRK